MQKGFFIEFAQFMAKLMVLAPNGITRKEWDTLLDEFGDVVAAAKKFAPEYAAAFDAAGEMIDGIGDIIGDEDEKYLGYRICDIVEDCAKALKRMFEAPPEPV